jgi:sulfide:quinone oxidoreductase
MRVLILGAGFGGLELATTLSETADGEAFDVTVIDQSDAFIFGYSKLDVMFGRTTWDAVRLPYTAIAKPGVEILQETITSIDPEARRVTTDAGQHEGDVLVVALGADYVYDETPGLPAADEFYSVAGAGRLADIIPSFTAGRAVIGICGAPYKCPPAPSECALLLHDYLDQRGVRDTCEITIVCPFDHPIPPSPSTSEALLTAFAERNITFVPGSPVASVDNDRGVATAADGTEHPFDLFLGIPKHRAPQVVLDAGMAEEDGYIAVASGTLETRFPGVYAVGDVATVGVPKAGVFAEGAAKVVARALIYRLEHGDAPAPYDGRGICYVEFGGGEIGRVDVDFLSGPNKIGIFRAPSADLVAEKKDFGAIRRARWGFEPAGTATA